MNESFFRINTRKANALINSVNDNLKKANQACLRFADDAYRKVIFKSEMYAANGVFTEKKAIEKAIADFEKQGLHCIEYADGSRRNIADYADMAIKTASQRAYLMGEGEIRKKTGETLIRISKHGGTCPLCAKWEGGVLIDDVYSGGTAEDGPYPLLSEAMAAGLYHPRCRHGCNTYYPEVDDVLSDDEENAIRQYIGSSSYGLNAKLRQNLPLTEEEKELIMNLDSALEKLPKYKGDLTRSLIFDDVNELNSFLEKHQVGCIVDYPAYTSTTFGSTYNPNGQVQIYIPNSAQGRNISMFNSAEKEVLYQRNSAFKVTEMENKNGIYYIYVKEG